MDQQAYLWSSNHSFFSFFSFIAFFHKVMSQKLKIYKQVTWSEWPKIEDGTILNSYLFIYSFMDLFIYFHTVFEVSV